MSAPLACTDAAATNPSSDPPTLLERIRALDRSAQLASRYTPLVLLHPAISSLEDASSYVAVGHAETAFFDSVLIHCKDDAGEPIFAKDRLSNEGGIVTEVLRLRMDMQLERDMNNPQERDAGFSTCTNAKLFEQRTASFEHVTNHLLSSGVISRKHSDLYPISPFEGSKDGELHVLAHVNRSTAPYLGIDSVGVHLHCYVCNKKGKSNDASSDICVWLAKRAPTKSHHPNFWDPTVAGGHPANLSLIDNIAKEAYEEAGVAAEWIQRKSSDATNAPDLQFSDHTNDPLTITTAKPDGACMKRSLYYSCDLQVPRGWTPTAVDKEVSEFKLYSMEELEEELRFGNSVRPAMRAVLLDFMIRHNALKGDDNVDDLRDAMRRERLMLW